jgi:eukaryotic-like serine/threonine-protein kinase
VLASPRKVLGDSLGRYQLLVQIGQGGMAEVFLGRLRGAAGFAKLVVIKKMHSHLSHDKRFIELFINEGRLVAQLSNPNICQVHELGEEEGSLFLVMEHLTGVPWDQVVPVLPRGSPYELPLIAGVLGQACDGLHHAHQLRDHQGNPTPVVHRDVSPQNLFVTTDGACKVLDFGVAKMSTSDRYSHTGVVLGKLPYMAPEQICGQPVDARTDVFAMGVVLWEALTGERLFSRPSDYLIWKAINEDPIPSVLDRRPELPPSIDELVRRALQRDPAARFPSIQAFAQELRAAVTPGAFANHAIADALRDLCAAQLAESALRVSTALADIDRPPPERSGARDRPLLDPSAGETLNAVALPSVMLRGEAFAQIRRQRPKQWRKGRIAVALGGAAALAALVAVLTRGDEPASGGGEPAAVAMVTAPLAEEPEAVARPVAPAPAAPNPTPAAAPPVSAAPEEGLAAGPAPGERDDGDAATDDAPARDGAAAAPDPAPRSERVAKAGGSRKPQRARSPARAVGSNAPSSSSSSSSSSATAKAGRAAPAAATGVGHYSVDSRPYATISIDGVAHGETPLYRIPLSPGAHQVRAVRQDGATKTFSITIVAGKEVSSGRLKW